MESGKDVARWVGFAIIGWFLTETLKQADLIPEFYRLKISVFTYLIPVRQTVLVVLIAAQGFIDKFLHERGKEIGERGWLGVKGLFGF